MKLDHNFLKKIQRATFCKTIGVSLENAEKNRPFVKKTIKDLKKAYSRERTRPALVVSGGPSLHRNNHIQVLKSAGFSGYTVVADGSMALCLRNGVVPDFVLTVDPDPHRIIRWFGDTRLRERPEDDYFKRQDLDPELNVDGEGKNRETTQLVNRFGSRIKLIISTSVSNEITLRAMEAGMDLFWWNPLFDDFEDAESVSRKLYRENHAPCMTTGGNVGSSCWVFAQAILASDPVMMIGMDFSYPPGTDVYHTQYYDVLKELYPDHPEKGLFEVYNPQLQETWLTDPAYYWYRQNFLEMVKAAQVRTINCTEGGILFGQGVEWKSFSASLTATRAS